MPERPHVTLTLDRGLRLLRALHAERAPLTNGELANRTGMSRSAISSLTSTLIQPGYIRRVAGGSRFELATGVFGIGQAYLETNSVTRLAQPLMQQLADRLDVSVALDIDTTRQRIVPALKQAACDLERMLRDVRYES